MKTVAELPIPRLVRDRFSISKFSASNLSSAHGAQLCDDVVLVTDNSLFEATGVRVAFTERLGGESTGPYASLNLGTHVNDKADAVLANRNRLLSALGAPDAALVVPNQVHGTDLAHVASSNPDQVQIVQDQIASGTDGVVVSCSNVAALLCFADCMPVIVVAPGGAFAVVHAGWRGVYGHIAPKALRLLCEITGSKPEDCNVYLGPYIHVECFEVGLDLAEKFIEAFGESCVPFERHIDLGKAMRTDLLAAGADERRIADAGICTVCNNDRFFSYRAQDGVCGRHGAVALRYESEE